MTSQQALPVDTTNAEHGREGFVDTVRLSELLTDFEQQLDASMSPHRLALGDLGMDRNGFVPRPYSNTAVRHWRQVLQKDPDDVVARHHLAIAAHARAIDLEHSEDPTRSDRSWKEALEHWVRLIEADAFWDWLTKTIAERGAQQEARDLRERLPVALVQMHLDIAFDGKSLNHRVQFHVQSAKEAPVTEEVLRSARKAVYDRFSNMFPEEVWISGQADPKVLTDTCENLIYFLERDPENEAAVIDLLRFQMSLVYARFVSLTAIGGNNPAAREEVLRQLARDGARCAPYLALLGQRTDSLESDIAESFVRWHRVMGDVHRALDDFARAVALYDAPSTLEGGDEHEARQCRDGAAESQALHALMLARDENQSALAEMAAVERRSTLTTWACFYGAQAYALLRKHEEAEALCEQGLQLEVKAANSDTEYAATVEQGKIHLRELLSILKVNRLLNQARERLADDKPGKALELVDEASQINNHESVLFLRIQCLIGLKRWDQAKEAMLKCREVAAGDPAALEALASLESNLEFSRSLDNIVLEFKNGGAERAEEFASTLVKKARDQDARRKLSMVFNAAAVEIANEQIESSLFQDTMAEIVKQAQSAANSGLATLLHRSFGNFRYREPCAVCDGVHSQAGIDLVNAILEHARSADGFSVKSVDQFWRTFDSHLCANCRIKFEHRQGGLRLAEHLLREALELDPKNEHARNNLQALT